MVLKGAILRRTGSATRWKTLMVPSSSCGRSATSGVIIGGPGEELGCGFSGAESGLGLAAYAVSLRLSCAESVALLPAPKRPAPRMSASWKNLRRELIRLMFFLVRLWSSILDYK